MAVNRFLQQFGFAQDPFESTNAEREALLPEYFVPPPYFTTILGDAADPVSQAIFAPRGTGKTAQRRMVELNASAAGNVLCVTYSAFDMPPGFRVDQADLAYHLNQVCRSLLIAVLIQLGEDVKLANGLTANQKQVLKYQVDRFLGPMSASEYRVAVDSIKSLGEKVEAIWAKYGIVVATGIRLLLSMAGLDNVEVPTNVVSEGRSDESLRFHFEQLVEIARRIGFDSVYVLVDKVDETHLTGPDPEATFALVQTILTHLPTLEHPGVAFKFFLWDRVEPIYRESGGRPDRVPIISLSWSRRDLEAMLSQRLLVHSAGSVSSMNELTVASSALDLDSLIVHFCGGSPRDMIRVAKRIISEETRVTDGSVGLSDEAIWSGLRHFCDEIANDLGPNVAEELRKVQQPTFTANRVANDVFHCSTQAASSKIQGWVRTGAVEQIGEIPIEGKRPQKVFGMIDLRVAVASLVGYDLPLILGNYAILCPVCRFLVLSDATALQCRSCHRRFKLDDAESLLSACTR